MIEILWIFFNYGILLWILILLFRAVKLVNKKYGKLSSSILTIGIIFLILGHSKNKQTDDVMLEGMNDSVSDEIKFSPINHLTIGIFANTIEQKYLYQTKFSSKFIFLFNPISWEQRMGEVSKTKQGYSYSIQGVKEWNLLSIKIYSQKMDFRGDIKSNKI